MADIAWTARLTEAGWRKQLLVAFGAGVLSGFGQAPVSLPWLTLIGFWLILRLFQNCDSPRRAALLGWVAGSGYFALTLSWIIEPFLVDIARHGWMAPFALLFCAIGFALFWGGAFGLAHWASRPGWTRALAIAAALTLAEMTRSYLWTGFPWALIGHVWSGWAPMQWSSWVGPLGLTFLTVLTAAALETAHNWPRRGAVTLVFVVLYGAGMWQALQPVPGQDGPRPIVRLVQPNAAQHLKWDPVMAPQFYARQLGYTAAPADPRPDLVIWPETSLPYLLNGAEGELLRVAAAADGIPVVLGVQRLVGDRAFNSLITLDEQGTMSQLYDKFHLVPFGEYMPVDWLLSRVGFSAFTAKEGFGFSAGPGPRVLDFGPLGSALPLICYEAIFPQDVRGSKSRPDWLLQITNDAWFGRVSGPYQHLAQARLRAVEMGLPLVRAANTGISAVIDARGQITASLPLNEAGFLDAALPPPLPQTLYAWTGDMPLGVVLVLLLGLIALMRRRNSG